jgi:preprotein translocase subunit SecA
MERLGLEDDVAIESRLVSRTIESAQSRVEGFNFDMRKRVVEFDDVINKQRETIYAERDKVIHNEDLTETVRAFIDEELDIVVDADLVGDDPESWNLEGLSNALHLMGLDGEGTSADELWEIGNRDAIAEHIHVLADERLEARATEVGEDDWATVERLVLVRTIDSLWVEHLTEIDDMRRGIGLRGYAQQDPLNEFRREAFRLYEELRGLIRHGVATTIFRVSVTREPAPGTEARPLPGPGQPARPAIAPPPPPPPAITGALPAGPAIRDVRTSLGDQPVAGSASVNGAGASASGPKPGFTPAGARIGRNDPCWCGSGAKYKKCHGR